MSSVISYLQKKLPFSIWPTVIQRVVQTSDRSLRFKFFHERNVGGIFNLSNMILTNFFGKSILKNPDNFARNRFVINRYNSVLTSCHAVKPLSLKIQPHRDFSTSPRKCQSEDDESKNFNQPYLPALMEFNEIR